ncbi:hypothetical protein R1flu_020991 [Riccia fluitans]|uniref:Uncharacterized protein n=1 Tax=Riccia fluitans TaxID=41844 RepID=A0ABD1ZNA7_9MARC
MHDRLRRCIGLGAFQNEDHLLELRDVIYEIEAALLSIGDPALSEAVLELYPDGYPTEQPLPKRICLLRQDLYDRLRELEVEDLCDVYQ